MQRWPGRRTRACYPSRPACRAAGHTFDQRSGGARARGARDASGTVRVGLEAAGGSGGRWTTGQRFDQWSSAVDRGGTVQQRWRGWDQEGRTRAWEQGGGALRGDSECGRGLGLGVARGVGRDADGGRDGHGARERRGCRRGCCWAAVTGRQRRPESRLGMPWCRESSTDFRGRSQHESTAGARRPESPLVWPPGGLFCAGWAGVDGLMEFWGGVWEWEGRASRANGDMPSLRQ